MASHSTTKNMLVELFTLGFFLLAFGIVTYNWEFLYNKWRQQGATVAEYLHEQNDRRTARNTRSQPRGQRAGTPDDMDVEGYERSVIIEAGFHGQFIAQSWVNDIPLTMMADTGASMVMLTFEDAEKIGLTGNLRFDRIAHTANGKGRYATLTIDRMRIGDVELENIRAGVLEKGKLRISLLGMSFIKRLKRFEMRGKKLVLVQ